MPWRSESFPLRFSPRHGTGPKQFQLARYGSFEHVGGNILVIAMSLSELKQAKPPAAVSRDDEVSNLGIAGGQ